MNSFETEIGISVCAVLNWGQRPTERLEAAYSNIKIVEPVGPNKLKSVGTRG